MDCWATYKAKMICRVQMTCDDGDCKQYNEKMMTNPKNIWAILSGAKYELINTAIAKVRISACKGADETSSTIAENKRRIGPTKTQKTLLFSSGKKRLKLIFFQTALKSNAIFESYSPLNCGRTQRKSINHNLRDYNKRISFEQTVLEIL